MAKRMLIDATHPEETRVVVMSGNRLEEFDFETETKKQLKGNIYLAKVTRVEPSLQAAFVDYGGNRHGFLAFSEVHPDYYRIPIADREELIKAEQEAAAEDDEPDERGEAAAADEEAPTNGDAEPAAGDADDEESDGQPANAAVETLDDEEEDDFEQIERRKRASHRRYRIQEVISRRQILLVQVTKEERGTKGAALTTYISLAGRYCVLMPNTPKGGGISRKINNVPDRKRLKSILDELKIPEGMAVIVRTAGAQRTKAEIRRDYDYLIKLWDDIREKTLSSTAPSLVHEEANLIKRSMRDLYAKDIDEILVEGEEGYRAAKDFMKTLTPSHAKKVQSYKDQGIPLFQRYQIEGQIDNIHSPTVQLKSGGYIVMNSTEALVAIDVNSGRSTRERNIEETAYRTNLEAADEVARQLRLRDLAGLIVIDFIDMEDYRNRHNVERRLKEAMRSDRARIQIGRISAFGLLEMSRQRLRPSVLEASSSICKHCGGSGVVRSTELTALSVLRAVEEEGTRHRADEITVYVPTEVALYMLNQKRDMLAGIEERYSFRVVVANDDSLIPPDHRIEVTAARGDADEAEVAASAEVADDGSKRRRSRRGGRRRKGGDEEATETADRGEQRAEPRAEQPAEQRAEGDDEEKDGERKSRRRGRRGGRRRRRDREDGASEATPATADEQADDLLEAAAGAVDALEAVAEATDDAAPPRAEGEAEAAPAEGGDEERKEAKPRRRRASRKAAAAKDDAVAETPTEEAPVEEPPVEEAEAGNAEAAEEKPKPRRRRAATSRRKTAKSEEAKSEEAKSDEAKSDEAKADDGATADDRARGGGHRLRAGPGTRAGGGARIGGGTCCPRHERRRPRERGNGARARQSRAGGDQEAGAQAHRLVVAGALRAAPCPGSSRRDAALRAAPALEPAHRLLDVRGGRAIGEAHLGVAARRVEVDPRRGRDPGFGEHPLAEPLRVVGALGDVGIEVEGAVGRRQPVEARLGQPVQENFPVARVDGDVGFELVVAVEGGDRGELAQRRRRDEQVLRQALDRPQQVRRQDHPADAPAGHREILGEAVDDHGVGVEPGDGCRRRAVDDAVIDLVGDEADAAGAAIVRDRDQVVGVEHGPGRVRRAGDDQAVERPRRLEQLDRGLVARRLGAGQRHRLDAEGVQDVLVTGIARLDERDPVAGVEGGEEAQHEARRRAGRHHDPLGRHLDPVPGAIVPGDPLAQRRDAERVGVAELLGVERGPRRLDHGCGRAGAGLADLQVNHIPASRLALIGSPQHIHYDERWDLTAARNLQGHHYFSIFVSDRGLTCGAPRPEERLGMRANWRRPTC